jgi:hypothetical protein
VALDVIGMLPGSPSTTTSRSATRQRSALPRRAGRRTPRAGRAHGRRRRETFAGYDRYRVLLALNRLAVLPKPVRKGLVRPRRSARVGKAVARSDSTPPSRRRCPRRDEQYLRVAIGPAAALAPARRRPVAPTRTPTCSTAAAAIAATSSTGCCADTPTYLPGPAGQDGPGDDGALARGSRPFARPQARQFTGRLPAQRRMDAGRPRSCSARSRARFSRRACSDRPKYGFAAPSRAGSATSWRASTGMSCWRRTRLRDHRPGVAAGMLPNTSGAARTIAQDVAAAGVLSCGRGDGSKSGYSVGVRSQRRRVHRPPSSGGCWPTATRSGHRPVTGTGGGSSRARPDTVEGGVPIQRRSSGRGRPATSSHGRRSRR